MASFNGKELSVAYYGELVISAICRGALLVWTAIQYIAAWTHRDAWKHGEPW